MFAGTAAISIWLGAFGVMYLATDASTALFWARVAHVGIPMLPAFIYLYITVGLRQYEKDKGWVWMSVLIAFAFVGLVFSGRLLLSGVEQHWWGYYPTYGPAGPFLVGYFVLVIAFELTELWGGLRNTPKGSVFHQRLAMSYYGGLIAGLAMVDFPAVFGASVYPFGYVAVIAFLTVIAAKNKHHHTVYMTPAFAAEQILATMQGAVLVTTPEGVVEMSNRAAGQLLGYSETELFGLSLSKVFRAEAESRSVLDDCLNGEQVQELETTWSSKEGGVTDVSISACLLKDNKSRPLGIVLAAVDITARKKAEEALRESERQLLQSHKMEAVGQLAGGIAHDFNNLLTTIIGNSSLALTNMKPDDPNRPLMEDIREVGERAATLTKQVLAFSRRQLLKPLVLSLNDVILDLEPVLRSSLRKSIDLRLSLSPHLRQSTIDPQQISQVLVNLAVNSQEAMADGGRLLIETRNATLDTAYCRMHREAKPGNYVMLVVSDSGTGMDKATQERLFEPFFTTKELGGVGKGTGMGLSTVYGIVKQSGGHISVYSEPGEGTTFRVYLPVAQSSTVSGEQSPAVSGRQPPPESDDAEGRSRRILVVEDEAPVRSMVVRVLSQSGYDVRAAASVQEIERFIEDGDYRPDLLLTDMILPGGAGGRQVADRLKERFVGLPVIFMSGYTKNTVFVEGWIEEGNAFLEKPFDADTLLRKVGDMLNPQVTRD